MSLPISIKYHSSLNPGEVPSVWSLQPYNYGNIEGRDQFLKKSNYPVCVARPHERQYFGLQEEDPADSSLALNAIPIAWSSWLSIMAHTLPNTQFWTFNYPSWGIDTLMPFLLPLMVLLFAVVALLPVLIISVTLWTLLFNIRFLFHKRVRRVIRKLLIKREQFRRWKLRHSYPTQHFRKLQERDRYRMPKWFQDSDENDDEEPEELKRKPIPRQKTTMWPQKKIDMIGFDPDNLPTAIVYGDLIGEPEELHPIVQEYVKLLRFKGASAKTLVADDSYSCTDQ